MKGEIGILSFATYCKVCFSYILKNETFINKKSGLTNITNHNKITKLTKLSKLSKQNKLTKLT